MKRISLLGIAAVVMLLGTACGQKNEGVVPMTADTVPAAAESAVGTEASEALEDISEKDGAETDGADLADTKGVKGDDTASDSGFEKETAPQKKDWTAQGPVSIVVENPGRGYYFGGEAAGNEAQAVKLEQILQKPNAIVDTEEWFAENDLEKPYYDVPGLWQDVSGNLPEEIPLEEEGGLTVIGADFDDDWVYVVYGNGYWEGYVLKIFDRESLLPVGKVDFTAYRYVDDTSYFEQRLWWARIQDGVLYASFGHGTYASGAPFHAYVTAVELDSGRVLWKSEPLVSNAYNFEIIGDILITGYGFTQEDDYLYQLDIGTGKIVEQIPVKSKPDYIIRKGDILYVRTYDTNYKFQIGD